MHELSLVMTLIEQVDAEVRRSGEAGHVARVTLRVGRLSGVNADAMRFAFDAVKPGSVVRDATLEINPEPAQVVCRDCGAVSPFDEWRPYCPECSSRSISVTGGRDLLLESIEVDA